MTGIEERVNQLLLAQDRAIGVARSYYQHIDAHGLPPEELDKEYRVYREAGVFCDFCEPSLIVIPSSACYRRSPDFWPDYFSKEHIKRDLLSMEYPFEGVRGAYYPFQPRDERQHLDIIEMDDPSYFNNLNDEDKINFMRQFFNALQITRESHAGLSNKSRDRTHVTSGREAFVVFASRSIPDYTLKVGKIAAIDLSPYRIYGRTILGRY